MKFFVILYWVLVAVFGGGTILFSGLSQAASSGSSTAIITTTYTPPPCDVDVPVSVDFGHVNVGDIVPKKFNINIKCVAGVTVQTSLKMNPGAGYSVTSAGDIAMHNAGTTVSNGALLKIFYNSIQVKAYSSPADVFCTATLPGTRTCTLTAELHVTPASTPGQIEGIVVFDVDFT